MKKLNEICNKNILDNYEIIIQKNIEDIPSDAYYIKHKKSGARIAILENEDDNKVFYIGFRTPVDNDKGIPHIVEHTVLCGSEKYKAKDPFTELVKGSLNTYLNACTYPDKTLYPIASQNEQDYKNLSDVYMDAVFNPNIYKYIEIFKQEGWNYRIENTEDKLEYNGVVYNEMRGVYSSAESIIEAKIDRELYPDTTYSYESGGTPNAIPTLTYEEYLDFHRKYYHPSNCYIYLYGDVDIEERLKWLNDSYLSKYDVQAVDSKIEYQGPFEKKKIEEMEYPIANDEDEEANCYFVRKEIVGDSLDKELMLAMNILDYALITRSGAYMKKALIDKNIGKDIYGGYDKGILQPQFSIYAKYAEEKDFDSFISTIEDTYKSIVENGIDKKVLKAAINILEFQYKEADYGSCPKGLRYGINMMYTWLYDETRPFDMLELSDTFAYAKKMIETDYFERLIEKYFINNNHCIYLKAIPKKGMAVIEETKVEKALADFKETLDEKQLTDMVNETKRLIKYQETPSTKEELATIPMLNRSDLNKKAKLPINKEMDSNGVKTIWHNINTNGIGYVRYLFKIENISKELIPYCELLVNLFGELNTTNYSYEEITNEIDLNSGGMSGDVMTCCDYNNEDNYSIYLFLSYKAFDYQMKRINELINEIMHNTNFDDASRILEIMDEKKSRLKMMISYSGNKAAMLRSNANTSEKGYIDDMITGIGYYNFLKDLLDNYDEKKLLVAAKLKEVLKRVFRKENLLISITGNKDLVDIFTGSSTIVTDNLYTEHYDKQELNIDLENANEGIKTAAQIQYVAMQGRMNSSEYSGTFNILRTLLDYDYLWNTVRVVNGAYGVASSTQATGKIAFSSYRDPHINSTIQSYKGVPEFLEGFEADEDEITKLIIGAISEIDSPMTPAMYGRASLHAYLSNNYDERIQLMRDQLLGTTLEDIHALAKPIREALTNANICVIGNETKIEKNKNIFDKVYNLN